MVLSGYHNLELRIVWLSSYIYLLCLQILLILQRGWRSRAWGKAPWLWPGRLQRTTGVHLSPTTASICSAGMPAAPRRSPGGGKASTQSFESGHIKTVFSVIASEFCLGLVGFTAWWIGYNPFLLEVTVHLHLVNLSLYHFIKFSSLFIVYIKEKIRIISKYLSTEF